jgi:uncharacterized coiled-coil DUF342 family protein
MTPRATPARSRELSDEARILRAELTVALAELGVARRELAALRHTADEYREQLRRLRSSFTWRAGAPFRRISRVLRRTN